jgi:arylsulfatase A-like enzyme
VTADQELFTTPVTSGYKQAIDAAGNPGMWTPFVLFGPGVRPGVALAEPISHVDQMPTLLHLLGVEIPDHVQGRVLTEILAAEGSQ